MEPARGKRNSYSLGCKIMSERTRVRSLSLMLLVGVFIFSPASRAQTGAEETTGINSGNYNIQETVELGYRKLWTTGNQDTYGTFVNLGTGLRVLDYTIDMRSLNHQGLLFDNLNFSNFGYGGDPDNVSRLRINKNKLYEFSLVFRRHKNFWDYNLLANPLNPVPLSYTNPSFASTNPSIPVTQSPHSLYLVRRMQDFDLTLLPQSRVRFRLGYSRYVNEGPSFSTFHGTTDFLVAQNFRMTTNAYHAGIDFRVLPKTTISYDQFLEYDKQDTSDTLANTPFVVSTGSFPGTLPVDMGLNWYYAPSGTASQACNNGSSINPVYPAVPTPFPSGYPGFANPNCKAFASYTRTAPARNSLPTERLSFQSTFIPRVEMSGSASYSSSNNVIKNLFDSANEWTGSSTSRVRNAIVSGPAGAKQVFAHANWTAIVSLTQKVRVVDSVRYDSWRNPGYSNLTGTNLFATGVQAAGQTGILLPIAQFAPLVAGGPSFAGICPAPYTAVTCPQHMSYSATTGALSATSTAAADATTTTYAQFLGQRLISNTVQLEADLAKRITGRIGYLYQDRQVAEGSASLLLNNTYFPGGTGALPWAVVSGKVTGNDYWAARGSCQYDTTVLSAPTFAPAAGGTCTQNSDGSVTWAASAATISAFSAPRTVFTIHEHVGLAGLTLRPMDTLRINADFEFGYSDYSYTRTWPQQVQGYKVHANYKPRTWAIIDGAIDIHENRNNVSQVNNLEHGRTYSISTVFMRNEKLAYTLGYNYTDLHAQDYICFRDSTNTAMIGPAGVANYLLFTPANSPCAFNGGSATINLGTTAFYSNKQHYAYSDIMWKPVKRVTATLGYAGSFAGGSTVFLDPLQPGGTLAFNYQKPFTSIQIDLYKGLSYKTTWNYYAYNSRSLITSPGLPVSLCTGSGANLCTTTVPATYALQPVGGPDFNNNTLMFALQYAF
jgi:hypothetical protein